MLGSVEVLIGKDDLRDYGGAGVKRTMVTAIECINTDGRPLLPLIRVTYQRLLKLASGGIPYLDRPIIRS